MEVIGQDRARELLAPLGEDDDAGVVEAHGGYRVAPFGGDPGDEELLRAAKAIVS